MKVKALWYLELNTECPNCAVIFDLLEQDEDFFAYGRQVCEHGTPRSTNYQTVCPKCNHEFLCDFEY